MSEILRVPEAMRGDIKLIRHIGDVWMRTNILHKNSAADASTKQVDIYMGCLKDNWRLRSSIGTDEIPFSCTSGNFTLATDKNYSIEMGTKNLPPLLMAAVMGMKVTEYFEGTEEKVLVQEKVTVPLSTVELPEVMTYLDISDVVDASTDIVKVVALRRKKDKTWWSLADTASEADRTFTLSTTAGGEIHLDFEVVAGSDMTSGEEFVLTIQHNRTMEADEFRLTEDGVTFPNVADFVLSWLVKVESGPSRGRKGCLIAKANNCMRTSDFDLGGDAQDISSASIEYSVNFEEEGDVELNFAWLT